MLSGLQPNFVQGLHNLLVQSTSNDTVQLKAVRNIDLAFQGISDSLTCPQATATLNKEFYKNPACIPALASIIASSPEQPVSLS